MRKEPSQGEELAVAAPHCYCGSLARLLTSWTESNLLRRFLLSKVRGRFWICYFIKNWTKNCENVMELLFKCIGGKTILGFFLQVDIEMPPHERALMGWLLRTKREVQDQIGHARAREKKLWIALFISQAFVFMVWFGNVV